MPKAARPATPLPRWVPLAAVVGVGLATQIFVRYWSQVDPFFASGSFYWGTMTVRAGILVGAIVLAIPIAGGLRNAAVSFGLGLPHVDRREALWTLGLVVLGTAGAILVLQTQSYRDAYATVRVGDFGEKLTRWALFTLSTSLPWELFHRGFLLHGFKGALDRLQLPAGAAAIIAIAFVTCFESLYHLIKPPEEAIAFIVGSPVLSYLAIRHRSLWIPLAGHLWIEGLWFAFAWF